MPTKNRILLTLLSPNQLARIMRMLDRNSLAIIATVWSAAFLMAGLALYTANVAHEARLKTKEAQAIEPIVPTLQQKSVTYPELNRLVERARDRFPKLVLTARPDATLEINAADASVYRDWLSALSYFDTIAPQIHWSIRDLCVGSECRGGNVMRAILIGERLNVQIPKKDNQDNSAPDGAKKS